MYFPFFAKLHRQLVEMARRPADMPVELIALHRAMYSHALRGCMGQFDQIFKHAARATKHLGEIETMSFVEGVTHVFTPDGLLETRLDVDGMSRVLVIDGRDDRMVKYYYDDFQIDAVLAAELLMEITYRIVLAGLLRHDFGLPEIVLQNGPGLQWVSNRPVDWTTDELEVLVTSAVSEVVMGCRKHFGEEKVSIIRHVDDTSFDATFQHDDIRLAVTMRSSDIDDADRSVSYMGVEIKAVDLPEVLLHLVKQH